MRKKVKKEYLKVLELGENATRDDIENAYSYFVKLYSSENSPEIHPLREEFSIAERNRILSEIDKAYKALVGEDAVNRLEFSSEPDPQEIVLEDDETDKKEAEEIEVAEDLPDENEPVIEFVDTVEPLVDLPVEESEIAEAGEVDQPDEIEENINMLIDSPQEDEAGMNTADNDEDIVVEIQAGGLMDEEPMEIEQVSPDEIPEQPTIETEEILSEPQVVELEEITGKFLKKKRETKGVKIKEMEGILNVSYKDVAHIENEKFEKLKDAGYLRWLIKSYAKFLGISEVKAAEDYMKRYRAKK